jgi:hypothetical protein
MVYNYNIDKSIKGVYMSNTNKDNLYEEDLDLMEALNDLGDAAATIYKDDLGVVKMEATPFFNDLSEMDKSEHIIISSKEELNPFYNTSTDTYELIKDGKFLSVTFKNPMIIESHLKAFYIYANFLKVKNITTYGLKAKDIFCEDIKAIDIVCQNLIGNHVYTKTLYAKDIILDVLHATSISYHAACICYTSLRTKTLTHRKVHFIQHVLKDTIDFI